MLTGLIIGAGIVLAGAVAARRFMKTAKEADGSPDAGDKGGERSGEGERKRATDPHRSRKKRGLKVGDVLLYADTELWLAGAIELDEEGWVARLFPTPGALRSEWVAQLDEAAQDLALLRSTDEVPAGAVPESLPVDGQRLSLERRGHAEVETEGEGLPATSAQAQWVILSEPGGGILFVVDFEGGTRLSLSGERVSRALVDHLPGGDD